MICPKFWTTWNVRVFTYRCHFLNHPYCEYSCLPIFLRDSDTLNSNHSLPDPPSPPKLRPIVPPYFNRRKT